MAFEFDADGFLTERRCLLELEIRDAYKQLFARAHQINRDCHELLFAANIHNRDGREVLVATLFIRALEHYQASILLLGTGLVAPAQVAIRATLEAVFTTRAVAAHEEALNAFINDDLLQRQKLIRTAQNYDHTNLEELRESLTDDLIQRLAEKIQETGAKPLTTRRMSQLAGMHDWYTTEYKMLSKATHTHVRELESYLSLGQTGEIKGLKYAPAIEEVPHLLLEVAHCIVLAADAVSHTFEIAFGSKASEHVTFIKRELASPGESNTQSHDA